MIEMQYQDSLERQFLKQTPLQYIVQLMKHRDYESRVVWEFDEHYRLPAPRRRVGGIKVEYDWMPNYAKNRHRQIPTTPIPAKETERRIYAARTSTSDFWSRLKKVNGKDFQLFWCVEDYKDKEYRGIDAHAALFIAGLHTDRLNRNYSTDQALCERYGDDYGVRNIIADCIRDAGLSVQHTMVTPVLKEDKYISQIHSVYDLRARPCHGAQSIDEIKLFYLTKSINDDSGSMCFGSNRKLGIKFSQFLKGKSNE